ncbi:MAG TPA: hypothetical protein VKU44_00600 [Terriglobia bacterium]|nr:hypothetical protein [Terriglobia bacterium]
MKRLGLSTAVVLAVLAVGAMAAGKAASPAAGLLTGTWDGVAHAPDGDENFTMTLEQTGDQIKGSISTENGGQLDITSGSFKKGALEILCETSDAKYHVTGKLKDGQLSGDWSKDEDQKGTWEAKRSAAKPAAK